MSSEPDFFHPELESFFMNNIEELSVNDVSGHVPIQPRTSKDFFYTAQTMQRDLEKLSADIHIEAGLYARDNLNEQLPRILRSQKLAIVAFKLNTLLESKGAAIPYEGEVLVAGVFEELDFGSVGSNKNTLIVPLIEPTFLRPYTLKEVKADKVVIPIMSMSEWNYGLGIQ